MLNCYLFLRFICLKHKESGIQDTKYSNYKKIVTPCKPCSRENAAEKLRSNNKFKPGTEKAWYTNEVENKKE